MTITNIENLTDLASTALAAYGAHISDATLKLTLENGGFTPTQANEFIDRYQYVDNLENQLSGLSATLFFDTIDQKHVLAIRGTEFGGLGIFNDVLSADLMGIGATGFASEQGADLYRYWKRLITPKGQEVSYSLTEMTQLYMLENASSLILGPIIGSAAFILFQNTFNDDIGLGLVDPYEEVNVTGHSLGGHLAIWPCCLRGCFRTILISWLH
jgi:hypothetical protein